MSTSLKIIVLLLLFCTFSAGYNVALWRCGAPQSKLATLVAMGTGLGSVFWMVAL